MLDLTAGEAFVTGFIFFAVVTAQYWPRMGGALARILSANQRQRRRDDAR